MLKSTFCHLPEISLAQELKLWQNGYIHWEDCLNSKNINLKNKIIESYKALENQDLEFFISRLPSNEYWRLFPEFRHLAVYLDIETTGISSNSDYITTIALYDGKEIKYYINGQNLHKFPFDIKQYRMLITYNGKTFDVPFIKKFFGITLDHAHIDLRYLLAGLGYKGGLKLCEKKLGLLRMDLADVDGYTAVLLWREFKRWKNTKALETLLAYNIQDVLNLELLMVHAYNLKLKNTPLENYLKIPLPELPKNPFKVDRETLRKIRYSGFGY